MNAARLLAAGAALAVGLLVLVILDDDDGGETVRIDEGASSATIDSDSADDEESATSAPPVDTGGIASEPAAEVSAPPDTSPDDPDVGDSTVVAPTTAGATTTVGSTTTVPPEPETSDAFPCSFASRQAMVDRLADVDGVESSSDTDLYLRTVARSILEVGQVLSEDERVVDLDERFDAFRTFPDGCPGEIDAAFSSGEGFLCQASRLSADGRIFEYLSQATSSKMQGCSYEDGLA